MQTLGMLWRYACASVSAATRTWQPDYALRDAVSDADEDLTIAFACASAAGTDLVLSDAANKVVVTYWCKSRGPYSYYCCEGDPISFPPSKPTRDIIPLEEQIVAAELFSESNSIDITEKVLQFAGPDGTFHGRTLDKDFDMTLLIPSEWETLVISYADGHETTHAKVVKKPI